MYITGPFSWSRDNLAMHFLSNIPLSLQTILLLVPADRIGFQQAGFSVTQLKIMQEVITLTVFLPFAMIYLKQPFKMDFVWAGLCMVGAVYFIFRSA
jgi:uncharacterized protein